MPKFLSSLAEFFIDIAEVVFLAFGMYLLLNYFVFQLHKVEGDSMYPTLSDKEYLLTDKLANRSGYKRGDIVIFQYPKSPDKDFVKRLIGLPGEKIEILNSQVIIFNQGNPNGFVLKEPYLQKDVLTYPKSFLKEGETLQIPDDSYFVMGDNREVSSDSRQWGFVPKKYMVGRAWARIWPIQEFSLIK